MQREEKSLTCCFTGHREIAPIHEESLPLLLEETVGELLEEGVRRFVTGGALGFDTLAAETVLHLKESFPDLLLTVIAPHRNQSRSWCREDRLRYESIRERADEFLVLYERYVSGCMRRRNHAMVDRSGICVAYLLHAPSGTRQTVDYALQSGLRVIDLCEKLEKP